MYNKIWHKITNNRLYAIKSNRTKPKQNYVKNVLA